MRWHRMDGYPTFSFLILFMVRGEIESINQSRASIDLYTGVKEPDRHLVEYEDSIAMAFIKITDQ